MKKKGRERSASMEKGRGGGLDLGTFILLAASEPLNRKLKVVLVSPSEEEDNHHHHQLKTSNLVVPPNYRFDAMAGSCNGLVCLHDKDLKQISLWNPTTGEHKILPPEPTTFGTVWSKRLVAFGFAVETNDYKVVVITRLSSESYRPAAPPIECLCGVQVYSLSTGSWRRLEGIIALPGYIFSCQDVLYLNGSCFFLSKFFHTRQQPCFPEGNRFVISFHFTKEVFNPLQLPDHHRDQELYLRSFGDKIALFTKSYHNAGTCEDFNIWLLNEEHGCRSNNSIVNKESWEKIHFFQIKHEDPCESNLPIGLSNDGQFALLKTCGSTANSKKVKLYHLLSKEVKQDFLSCSLIFSKAHAYKPSLVSIIGGNGGSSHATGG